MRKGLARPAFPFRVLAPASSVHYPLPDPGGGRDVIEGLGFVRLEVGSLARSLAFYRGGLCFELADADAPVDGRATLHAGGLTLVLVQAPDGAPVASGAAAARGEGVDLAVAVSGVDAYHDALVARGVSPGPPHDDGPVRSFAVVDPDGYRWRFVQSLA